MVAVAAAIFAAWIGLHVGGETVALWFDDVATATAAAADHGVQVVKATDGSRRAGPDARFVDAPPAHDVRILRDDAASFHGAAILTERRDLVRADKVNATIVVGLSTVCSILALYDLYLLASLAA